MSILFFETPCIEVSFSLGVCFFCFVVIYLQLFLAAARVCKGHQWHRQGCRKIVCNLFKTDIYSVIKICLPTKVLRDALLSTYLWKSTLTIVERNIFKLFKRLSDILQHSSQSFKNVNFLVFSTLRKTRLLLGILCYLYQWYDKKEKSWKVDETSEKKSICCCFNIKIFYYSCIKVCHVIML